MTRLHIALLLLILVIGCVSLQAATIRGSIFSGTTPIAGANATLKGTSMGANSDEEGHFEVANIPPGKYQIIISYVGYQPWTKNITLGDTNAVARIQANLIEESIQGEEVVVTASRHKEVIHQSTASMSIIDRASLNRQATLNFDDALRKVGGITINKNQINIRNSSGYAYNSGSRVLVLMEGTPLMSMETGTIPWDGIPLDMIKSVEVMKGAGSALYGSQAMGGVVNLLLADPSPTTVGYARLVGGFWDKPYYREWRWDTTGSKWYDGYRWIQAQALGASSTIGRFGFHILGVNSLDQGYMQATDYHRQRVLAKAVFLPRTNMSFDALFLGNSASHSSGLRWKNADHPLEVSENIFSIINDSYDMYGTINHDWRVADSVNLRTSYRMGQTWWAEHKYAQDSTFIPETTLVGDSTVIGSRLETRPYIATTNSAINHMYSGEEQVNWNLGHNMLLITGINGKWLTTRSITFGNHWQNSVGGYAQGEYGNPDVFKVQTGFLVSGNSTDAHWTKGEFSPRFGANWQARKDLSVRASVGRGYRYPVLGEMFVNASAQGVTVVANDTLRSETGWAYEVGGNYRSPHGFVVDGAIFRQDYEDLIDPKPMILNGQLVVMFKNYTKAMIYGSELEVRWDLWNGLVTGRCSYMYTQSFSLDSVGLEGNHIKIHSALPYRPNHTVVGEIVLNYQGLSIGPAFRYQSKSIFGYSSSSPAIDAKVIDLNMSYQWSFLEVGFQVKNLFQYNYQEIDDSMAPIRNYNLSLTLKPPMPSIMQ